MSNEKLAEALEHTARHRAATEGIDPDQWRVVLFKWEALALQAHAAEAAHPQPAQDAKGCVWSEDEEGNWDTGCGNMFVLNKGTPYDNEMGFCCFCGGKLDQVTQADATMKESGR